MKSSVKPILHITRRADWEAALAAGAYRGDTLEAEGFIHCSRPDQVAAVANTLFRGVSGLVLLVIDPARVAAEIRHENLEGGDDPYPHIYGPLEAAAVTRVLPFEPGADGAFSSPAL